MDAKPLLIETIRIQNGRVRNVKYHNLRCNNSRKILFGSKDEIDLRNVIDTTKAESPEVKCRIAYDNEIRKVAYEPYFIPSIHSLEIVEVGDFDYSFKYANRKELQEFYNKRGIKDDILMTRHGFIADTYYANVALYKKGNWYTPKDPLLKGSTRARLLFEGKIIEEEIHVDQINEYAAITLFNAMIPYKRIVINL